MNSYWWQMAIFIGAGLVFVGILAYVSDKFSVKIGEVGWWRATLWLASWPFYLGRAICTGLILFVLAIPSIIEFLRRIIMDPVNKWLTVVILMFIALIITIGWKSGSGRYEITVAPSVYENKQVVYVLDTKSGEVTAKLHDESDHFTAKGRARGTIVVMKDADPVRSYDYNRKVRRQNYSTTPKYGVKYGVGQKSQ